ncbi:MULTISPECIES: 2-dehydropantoate 2-reductase [unclassified Clostridium]|uniref:ketopantoate reductase family protein n=1 Tax=unclassified Clostridium TaxID=2614128 RepID=UPI0002972559|nr:MULTISPECIES: 2-dehydropantoate 2-reductase [unclassified Clostridium]EKQ52337.1 MAG: 2-dehydropantoate 2-reductase [Clostridium sp. Maddingley MBC34-26]
MKIGIIGIGAIGGYISAMLSKSREDVYVLTSGKALEDIKNNGITLKSELGESFVAYPTLVTEDVCDIGIMDIVFICVKGYSLKAASKAILPMVGEHTIVVPIINGVDVGNKVYSYLGKGKIIDTVMYINSKVEGTGIIRYNSKKTKIIISSNKKRPSCMGSLEIIYGLLNKSEIICEINDNAEVEAWKKYVFNCAFNVTDSYYDVKVKGILEDKMKFETFCNVARECEEVGRTKGVNLPDNIYETTINILKKVSKKSISSMHRDVVLGKKFELELFCGELCRMGKDLGVPTPYTQKAYDKLKILQPM